MASGNRTVILRMPEELVWLIENSYQPQRKIVSRQQAIIELLETHPALFDLMAAIGYDVGKGKGHETGV